MPGPVSVEAPLPEVAVRARDLLRFVRREFRWYWRERAGSYSVGAAFGWPGGLSPSFLRTSFQFNSL